VNAVADSRRRAIWIGVELAVVVLAFGGLALGLGGLRVSRAEVKVEPAEADNAARQVTVFAIVATPGAKTVDSKLSRIKTQLDKLMPQHGFKLLDVQSKRLVTGESVTCDLRNGYTTQTELVGAVDENGKVPLRCELFLNQNREFSTLVKTPMNQLFFCERQLQDGSALLIGVGTR
jgi:hypothetical protein